MKAVKLATQFAAAALLCVVLCVVCPLLRAEQRGIIKAGSGCSIAIDGGRVECVVNIQNAEEETKKHPAGKGWDLWVQASSRGIYLNPQNRAMLARTLHNDGTMADCRGALFKHERLRIDDLPPQVHVCVLTPDRVYGELMLESTSNPGPQPLVFSYIFWK